jgi:hypothetical protein
VAQRDLTAEQTGDTPSLTGAVFRLTDLGNAERLVFRHGRDVRYVPGLGWFV